MATTLNEHTPRNRSDTLFPFTTLFQNQAVAKLADYPSLFLKVDTLNCPQAQLKLKQTLLTAAL